MTTALTQGLMARYILAMAVTYTVSTISVAQTAGPPSQEPAIQKLSEANEVVVTAAREIRRGQADYVKQVPPQYPPLAKRFGIEGKVDAAVLVNREGRPLKVAIVRREPFYSDVFDASVRKSLMQSQFKPDLPPEGKSIIWLLSPMRFLLDPEEKSTPPQVVKATVPEYPTAAAEQGLEGWVAVAVSVDARGKVDMDRTYVLGRSPAHFSAFDAKARDAVQKSEFRAGTYNGEPGFGGLLMRVDFTLPSE